MSSFKTGSKDDAIFLIGGWGGDIFSLVGKVGKGRFSFLMLGAVVLNIIK